MYEVPLSMFFVGFLALDLGLVLYECLPHIPPSGTLIRGENTLGSCP